ncbi:hypothetical protein TOPH_02393 [Tolypocladium ophioglossoides CBS 100239]|uniref:Fungal STAND N-terminal Goodbye domain-containing protein n=1 Tax=Tolypocladium ophioglossoides (strain CBS 100239) TaxID=1163406 RepID=A0A0L0NGP9_TOLOC|nr:hypothetical protein TOPH_02393 [Tolypocladium ophioglossoides CBS 100239]
MTLYPIRRCTKPKRGNSTFSITQKSAKINSSANVEEELSTLATSPGLKSQRPTPSSSSTTLDQSPDTAEASSTSADNANRNETGRSIVDPASHTRGPGGSIDNSTSCDDDKIIVASQDVWSTAYREAVDSLGQDVDAAILQGKSLEELFKKLEEINKERTQESAFVRGVRYLHSLQVPLETFKLALDIAIPIASMQPGASMTLGIVKGVTAIAITFSTADVEFAKQIGEMLRQLAYIDECDALDQRNEGPSIHKALVLVYQKLLEFYNAALEILSKKGAKLVIKMVLETDRLPNIVKEFLQYADSLHKLVQTATWNIAEDIKTMLIDHDTRWLGAKKVKRQGERHAYQQDIRADQACESLLSETEFIN